MDKWGFRKVDKVAQRLPELVEQGKFAEAFGIWRGVEYELKVNTYGVDMYNVLTKKKASASVPGKYFFIIINFLFYFVMVNLTYLSTNLLSRL